ncbi:ubiquitin carboxyl-terminal hydrolase 48-like isoform X4 [Panonychus citri]|uniref:ubiquitin carboxyl-terminal hydrolase 48-like isoform X4 n=1 Tax=Panonychus citri TaxID=50023 RepID=UPI002307BE89|nr:ubiquitin carboxyl-terminal hydrolase 48-like isoform X4 [Panonychus citri]XP_053213444.1 ubiquitin carboxyl-terminal hydrolase 48-like isoform X4 [Panonychus citri]
MKCVNSEGASILFSLYSGHPRLTDSLCRQCVELKVNPIQPQMPPMPKLNLPLDPVNYDCPTVNETKEELKCIHQRSSFPSTIGDQNFPELKKNDEMSKSSELNNYEQLVLTMKVNGMNDENVNINDSAHCKPCSDQLVEKEMEKLSNYKDAKIYVRKIQNEPDDQQDPDAEDDSYDSSFQGVTRKRMKNQQGIESHSIQSAPPASPRDAPRRSSRRRKYRDEREFTVSSLQTLLSLKIEIMHDFKVAPYDQDLFLNEVPLQGNDRTLAELGIVPNCLIYLKVDEPSCSGSSMMEEDYIKDHAPETGFKGTQLQKC